MVVVEPARVASEFTLDSQRTRTSSSVSFPGNFNQLAVVNSGSWSLCLEDGAAEHGKFTWIYGGGRKPDSDCECMNGKELGRRIGFAWVRSLFGCPKTSDFSCCCGQ